MRRDKEPVRRLKPGLRTLTVAHPTDSSGLFSKIEGANCSCCTKPSLDGPRRSDAHGGEESSKSQAPSSKEISTSKLQGTAVQLRLSLVPTSAFSVPTSFGVPPLGGGAVGFSNWADRFPMRRDKEPVRRLKPGLRTLTVAHPTDFSLPQRIEPGLGIQERRLDTIGVSGA